MAFPWKRIIKRESGRRWAVGKREGEVHKTWMGILMRMDKRGIMTHVSKVKLWPRSTYGVWCNFCVPHGRTFSLITHWKTKYTWNTKERGEWLEPMLSESIVREETLIRWEKSKKNHGTKPKLWRAFPNF